MSHQDDDLLSFIAESDDEASQKTLKKWHVLIVDDEQDVHDTTVLALKNLNFNGYSLEFHHSYKIAQAIDNLTSGVEFAVVIIDVVMESDDAGFRLVKYIREELNNNAIRIILRTGQPGYAPEIETIQKYDINDYKTKSELTQTKLYTSLALAIRTYTQINQLKLGRRGLEQIVTATSQLSRPLGLKQFAAGLLTQLCALLNIKEESLLCAVVNDYDKHPYVLAAAGDCKNWIGMPVELLPNKKACSFINMSLASKTNIYKDSICLFFTTKNNLDLACFVDTSRELTLIEQELLENFCSSISIAFENLQLYETINDLAFLDGLVDLPNKNALFAAIEANTDQVDTLALVDIDNFADINSIIDDSFGDAVLCAVASQLRACFAPSVLVTRLGSDLFGLLGPAQDLNPETIKNAFVEPVNIKNNEPLRVSVTTGFTHLDSPAKSAPLLLREASAALKQAKRFHRGSVLFFQSDQAEAARDRINLLNKLRASLSEEHFYLDYQPFVSLSTGKVVGAEALLRWRTTSGDFIPPTEFIPIAEQSGLMVSIGEWVLNTAFKWRVKISAHVDADFRIAVNVSQTQFADPDFVSNFIQIMQSTGIYGSQIEIELTESIAIENTELVTRKMSQLRAYGIKFAMDDFGTGYSSLSVIQQLSVDRIKIDRSFVSGNDCNKNKVDISDTIIALAKQLKIATIAEGIETQEQLNHLLGYGCNDGQGYLFSRPLAGDKFLPWLKNYNLDHGQ